MNVEEEIVAIKEQLNRLNNGSTSQSLETTVYKRLMKYDGDFEDFMVRLKILESRAQGQARDIQERARVEDIAILKQHSEKIYEELSNRIQSLPYQSTIERIEHRLLLINQTIEKQLNMQRQEIAKDFKLNNIQLFNSINESVAQTKISVKRCQNLELLLSRQSDQWKGFRESTEDQLRLLFEEKKLMEQNIERKVDRSNFDDLSQKCMLFAHQNELRSTIEDFTKGFRSLTQSIEQLEKNQKSLRYAVTQIDYNLLMKSTKMDNEINLRRVEENEQLILEMQKTLDDYGLQYLEFQRSLDDKITSVTDEAKKNLREYLNTLGQTIIKDDVQKIIKAQNLEKVVGQYYKLQSTINGKADRSQIDQLDLAKVSKTNFDSLQITTASLKRFLHITLFQLMEFMQVFDMSEWPQKRKVKVHSALKTLEIILEQMEGLGTMMKQSSRQALPLSPSQSHKDIIYRARTQQSQLDEDPPLHQGRQFSRYIHQSINFRTTRKRNKKANSSLDVNFRNAQLKQELSRSLEV